MHSARACIEARRRQHDAAEPEHLLATVLDDADATRRLRDLGIDPLELRERLDARLAEIPATGGYRDGTDVPISPPLARVLLRVAARRWRHFGTRMPAVEALLLEPAIATLVVDLRRGNDYRHVLSRATARAVSATHTRIGIEHCLRVLADLRSFADTIRRAGGDLHELRSALDHALSRVPVSPNPAEALPPLEPAMRNVVASTESSARRSNATVASIRQLCLELAREETCEPYWTAAGVTAAAFIRAVHMPDETSKRA